MIVTAAIRKLSAVIACATLAVGCQRSASPAVVSTDGEELNSPSAVAASESGDREEPSAESPDDDEAIAATGGADEAKKGNQPAPSEAPAETEVASAASPAAAAAASAKPRAPLDMTFDDIKFDIKPDAPFKRSMLTDKIEKLDGKPVRIRGYILPSFQQTGLTQFVLVRDNQACCFGPGAALYDCIVVEMKPGKSTDFNLYPVAVEGTFTISEMNDPDGKALAIYHLDGDEVR